MKDRTYVPVGNTGSTDTAIEDGAVAPHGCEVASFLSHGLSLRRNFLWTFAGNVVYALCQWGMLVSIAKLGTPEMVGQFALGLAITAPVIMLTNLQLAQIQTTDAKREYSFADYLGLRLMMTSAAVVVILGIVLFMHQDVDTKLVILAIMCTKAVEAISDVYYGLFQQRERMDRSGKSLLYRGVMSVVALWATVYLTRSVFWGVIANLAVWTLVLLFHDAPWATRLLRESKGLQGTGNPADGGPARARFDRHIMARLAKLAFPMGVVMMMLSLQTNIPRYFVERFGGAHQLGIFAAVAYLMTAGRLVVIALGTSASPRLAKYYAESNPRAFRSLLLRLLSIGVALGAAGVVIVHFAGRQLLELFYGPDYSAYSDVLMLTMIAAAVSYLATSFTQALTAARYFAVQLPVLVATATLLTLCCFRLIPSMGLLGAGWSLIIVASAQSVGALAVLTHALIALDRRGKSLHPSPGNPSHSSGAAR